MIGLVAVPVMVVFVPAETVSTPVEVELMMGSADVPPSVMFVPAVML
jgi:hypothetical protein